MIHLIGAVLAAAATLAEVNGLENAAPDAEPLDITWSGKRVTLADLPDSLQSLLIDPVEVWTPFARKRGYRAIVSEDGRAMLLLPRRHSRAKRLTRSMGDTLKWFDATLMANDPSAEPPRRQSDLDQSVVLVEFHRVEDARAALTRIREEYPYYGERLGGLAAKTGFLLPQLLVGGWSKNASGVEQWHPEHELIHRLAHLLLLQRFGPLPRWLALGTAWNAEFDLKKRVHCFPGRDGFVAIQEHSGWQSALKTRFRKRKDQPLRMAELSALGDGSFDDEAAGISWGTVAWLKSARPGATAALCGDFATYRKKHRRGGRNPVAGMPTEEAQLEALVKNAGADALDEISLFFRTGRNAQE